MTQHGSSTPTGGPVTLPERHKAGALVASVATLVTPPGVYFKVRELVDDPASSTMHVANAIAMDPALTARLLKLVNSAFLGTRGRIESAARAVSLLGMLQVHDLVLATTVATTFKNVRPELMDVDRFWRGSVARSLAASALARQAGLMDVGRVFTEGLLSDLGHIVLYQTVPALAAQARQETRGELWRIADVERTVIGCHYGAVGGALADAWRLPECFGNAIRHQTDPRAGGATALEASLLHVAGAIADGMEDADNLSTHVAATLPDAWSTIGVTPDCLPTVVADIQAHLASTLRMFDLLPH
jgi:HD-like signal output (HDOD) protein